MSNSSSPQTQPPPATKHSHHQSIQCPNPCVRVQFILYSTITIQLSCLCRQADTDVPKITTPAPSP
ncbi:putative proline-rich receptor-like protein kinase PERK3 [Iris pallida]|uniref:Proline-rich receptor-like protein kinase PERK3 n=1 Tax=Iris pallida TaxID=29817 RepID=A0AAX6FTF1_IRIPA|nr:putative proline-rich receptor-like protein kinase PERK3 [Iris pallida]